MPGTRGVTRGHRHPRGVRPRPAAGSARKGRQVGINISFLLVFFFPSCWLGAFFPGQEEVELLDPLGCSFFWDPLLAASLFPTPHFVVSFIFPVPPSLALCPSAAGQFGVINPSGWRVGCSQNLGKDEFTFLGVLGREWCHLHP